MITSGLFDHALIDPAKELGANKLFVVSGYASPAMVQTHFSELARLDLSVEISLIIGMAPLDAINHINHQAFQNLMERTFPNRFYCSYINKLPRVHSKVYSWFKDDIPVAGFIGSSNYTQVAFLDENQLEVLDIADPIVCSQYYKGLVTNSLFCTHSDASILVSQKDFHDSSSKTDFGYDKGVNLEKVSVSLLTQQGNMGSKSSLNWGQRGSRDRNEAYIPLCATIARSDFFPPIAQHFTVLTDDDKVLIMSKAQANGKALHTPERNSILGEYFRHRLGLEGGSYVKRDNLENYGRSDVTFYKIDDETYYMDFSV